MKFPLIPTIDLSPLGETQHCSLMGMCVANVDIQYFWWEWGVRGGLPRGGGHADLDYCVFGSQP